uniref:Uncharacterized protein n=1 Tax=Panagrolaimus sp. JU765 TaxID=591449 RepID=A0AC34QVU0_9BILA
MTPSLYGVVELDANLKNTIESLEKATGELKKLTALDLDYKMPGLAAFRSDTEQMISMLHNVCRKVEDALDERRNDQIIMNSQAEMRSSQSSMTRSTGHRIASQTSVAQSNGRESSNDKVVQYDVELKIKMIPKQ